MKRLLLTLALGLGAVSINTFAMTDYSCVSSCTSQGNLYGLCVSRCSYDSMPVQTQAPRQTDWSCVNNCTAQGFNYNLCTQRCSF